MNQIKSQYFFFCLFAAMFFASSVLAADTGKITGFAWGGNDLINGAQTGTSSIGWISFSGSNCGGSTCNGTICTGTGLPTGCPTGSYGDYKVTITDDGNNSTATLSGYAWSGVDTGTGLGWVSFKQADLAGCPSGACKAWVDTTCPSGKCGLYGWAKVISVNAGNNGGWDGFIHLNYSGACDDGTGKSTGATGCPTAGTTVYGAYFAQDSGKLMGYLNVKHNGISDGYAASNYDVTTGTIGWIRLTGYDAHTDYPLTPVVTLLAPTAKIACDATGCPGTKVKCGCDADGNNCLANWIMYQPVASPTCNFQLKNFSTNTDDPSTTSAWTIGTLQKACNGKCDYGTVQQNLVPGSYTISLKMENSVGNDTTTHSLLVLNDVHAGLMCSLDDHVWQVCSSPNFTKNISKNGIVYFRDDQLIATGDNNYSWPSDGETIVSRTWSLNGASINPVDAGHNVLANGTETSGTMDKTTNTLILTVTDSNGRTAHVSYPLSSNSLPQWQEISPIGAIWKNLLAGVFGIINSIPR